VSQAKAVIVCVLDCVEVGSEGCEIVLSSMLTMILA
jgi:hypothetical protein